MNTELLAGKIPPGTYENLEMIELDKNTIREWWAAGIFNDVAYVALILQLDKRKYQTKSEIDFDDFAEEWAVGIGGENGNIVKEKTLKHKAIRDAIDKMQKAGLVETHQQLSLQLLW